MAVIPEARQYYSLSSYPPLRLTTTQLKAGKLNQANLERVLPGRQVCVCECVRSTYLVSALCF